MIPKHNGKLYRIPWYEFCWWDIKGHVICMWSVIRQYVGPR
jgi:hypothetical protein